MPVQHSPPGSKGCVQGSPIYQNLRSKKNLENVEISAISQPTAILKIKKNRNVLMNKSVSVTSVSISNQNLKDSVEIPLLYDENDKGPFCVLIKSSQNKHINDIAVGQKLKRKNVSAFKIEQSNKFKVKVLFSNFENANDLISKVDLSKFGLTALIPFGALTKKGVIYNVPEEISVEDLRENLESTSPIVSITRMQKKISGGRNDSVNSIGLSSVAIVFRTQLLPENIVIYGATRKVNLFKPKVRFCSNCLDYGHIDFNNSCKRNRICNICAQSHAINSQCSKVLKCYHCGLDHQSNSDACKIFKKKEKIISKMIYSNKSYKEAEQFVLETDNFYEILNAEEEKDTQPVENEFLTANRVSSRSKEMRKSLNERKKIRKASNKKNEFIEHISAESVEHNLNSPIEILDHSLVVETNKVSMLDNFRSYLSQIVSKYNRLDNSKSTQDLINEIDDLSQNLFRDPEQDFSINSEDHFLDQLD